MKCPRCGEKATYYGLIVVECGNKKCSNFKAPPRTVSSARVNWNVNGNVGSSDLLALEDAQRRVDDGNKAYGNGTYWLTDVSYDDGTTNDEDIAWMYGLR